MPMLDRRRALALGAAAMLSGAGAQASFAAVSGERKLLLVILRGAMDGLAAVPPLADPAYAALRGRLALPADKTLPLVEGFGLHPRLAFLHTAWTAGELGILHAAASPYRDRSHFDGQDVLESGADRVFAASDGWLNRALALSPAARGGEGVAIAPTIPLVLRGPAKATSWAPSRAPAADDDTVARLMDLYADDPALGGALAAAVETAAIAGDAGAAMAGRPGARFGVQAARGLAEAAARLMSAPNGPIAGVLSLDGWDTHANQGALEGALAQRFAGLDAALSAFRQGMGPRWSNTLVLVVTEFGRTVAANGAGGTDHGAGGVAFALGGPVRGGRFLGDWPGLARGALFQGRDLAPANDLRALFMAALETHWGATRADLERKVFPGAAGAPRLSLV